MSVPPSSLQAAKLWLVHHVHLAKDALHIYVALTVLFGSALLFGWRVSSWRPWLLVALAAIAGEIWDLRDNLAYGTPVEPSANLHDIWNTLFWPSVILILGRWTPLFGSSTSTRTDAAHQARPGDQREARSKPMDSISS